MCERSGLMGPDADEAICRYMRGVPLASSELADMKKLSAEERAVALGARYGSDGARVASILVSQ